MAALASNGNGSTEKVEAAMENMSVNEPAKGKLETVIGIDLGTTFSCVAVWDEAAGRPMVLTNSTGAKTMPSYVSFTDQARVVGQPAKSQAASNPANTVYDVKRIIGRSWNDQVRVQAEFEYSLPGAVAGTEQQHRTTSAQEAFGRVDCRASLALD